MKTLSLLLVTFTLLSGSLQAQKLDSKIMVRITKISRSLDDIDQHMAANNNKGALGSLKAADAEMKKILSWYKGKFDESHPDFVAIKTRLAASRTKVASKAGVGTATATAKQRVNRTTAGTPAAAGGTKGLDSKVAARIKTIAKELDALAKSVRDQNLKQANMDLKAANKEMKKILSWYKGKFDESHPDFVAIKQRLTDGRDSLNGEGGLVAQAAGVGNALNSVLQTMQDNQKALKNGVHEARTAIASFESAMSQSQRSGNDKRIDSAIADIRNSVERTLLVHAIAKQTATDFEKQYPDVSVLKDLVKNTLDAEWALRGLKSFPESWAHLRLDHLKSKMYEARASNKGSQAAIKRGLANSDFMSSALRGGRHTVWNGERIRDFAGALMGSTDIPNGPTDKEMASLRASQLEFATEVDQLAVMVAKADKTNSDLKTMKLAKARFHETQYKGGEWAQVCKEMTKAFEADTKNKRVHRIAVHSPWDERTEARWLSNRWIVGTYRYAGGTVLALLPDGRFRVYRINFRRTQQGDGSFGAIKVFGIGHSYEVLAENKDK